MKLVSVAIHNFRSIQDTEFFLGNYSLLVGPNNCGKSNLIDAIRIAYEKDLKFEHLRDFPKYATKDAESWIELEYELNENEIPSIRSEYLVRSDHFRIRKWFFPLDKAKAGYFGYEQGNLSENLFYGWKNVSQSKLGNLVYIPAVSKLEDHTKLTGPSPLRDLVQNILDPIIGESQAFTDLKAEFEKFSRVIKKQETPDHRSLEGLEQKINEELKNWNAQFQLDVINPEEDQILKNLIRHSVLDGRLQQSMLPESFGHGFQRHLIFTLISVASSYVAPKKVIPKKDFSPELTLIMFEEPEAYLHPPQQDVLDASLRKLSKLPSRQVIASTHSAHFVSSNTLDLASIVLLRNHDGRTDKGQVAAQELKEIFENNEKIREVLGIKESEEDEETKMALEAAKYMFWLNSERAGLFFARYVLIVEGLSEQILINQAIKEGFIRPPTGGIFILEVAGKYNIHRFMNLFSKLRIEHFVMHDEDGRDHAKLNELIAKTTNAYTKGRLQLVGNLESELGLKLPGTAEERRRWKAAWIFLAVQKKTVDAKKLNDFYEDIRTLIQISETTVKST
jgi:putative ATP-dependent endonuclease of the OLD family